MQCKSMQCNAMQCNAMQCNANICYAMLCYTMLRSAMLCYAMLCYAMLCYAMLCYAMLCYAMLCYAMLCYAMLWYAMLCYAMLCDAILYCTILYFLLKLCSEDALTQLRWVSCTVEGVLSAPSETLCTRVARSQAPEVEHLVVNCSSSDRRGRCDEVDADGGPSEQIVHELRQVIRLTWRLDMRDASYSGSDGTFEGPWRESRPRLPEVLPDPLQGGRPGPGGEGGVVAMPAANASAGVERCVREIHLSS